MIARGRLAPTPSGRLHLGNLTAFVAAWLSVRQARGRLLLRVEDIDKGRARPEIEDGLREDLAWLGLNWDEEGPRQSERDYAGALERLAPHLYYCTCNRKKMQETGGFCDCHARRLAHGALRFRLPQRPLPFTDRAWGPQRLAVGAAADPTLVRHDGVPTYTLAVVADDVRDGVTQVVRGADLLEYTGVQLAVWEALGASPPSWLHTPVIWGPDGKKLSKTHASLELFALRQAGWSPQAVCAQVMPWLGLPELSLKEAIPLFEPAKIRHRGVQMERHERLGAPLPWRFLD